MRAARQNVVRGEGDGPSNHEAEPRRRCGAAATPPSVSAVTKGKGRAQTDSTLSDPCV